MHFRYMWAGINVELAFNNPPMHLTFYDTATGLRIWTCDELIKTWTVKVGTDYGRSKV